MKNINPTRDLGTELSGTNLPAVQLNKVSAVLSDIARRGEILQILRLFFLRQINALSICGLLLEIETRCSKFSAKMLISLARRLKWVLVARFNNFETFWTRSSPSILRSGSRSTKLCNTHSSRRKSELQRLCIFREQDCMLHKHSRSSIMLRAFESSRSGGNVSFSWFSLSLSFSRASWNLFWARFISSAHISSPISLKAHWAWSYTSSDGALMYTRCFTGRLR